VLEKGDEKVPKLCLQQELQSMIKLACTIKVQLLILSSTFETSLRSTSGTKVISKKFYRNGKSFMADIGQSAETLFLKNIISLYDANLS
jgi:hypothetical protein